LRGTVRPTEGYFAGSGAMTIGESMLILCPLITHIHFTWQGRIGQTATHVLWSY
ncbi:hypothetical protein BT96DRAFT_926589, partial [Gymnopus androsaceus JB14]